MSLAGDIVDGVTAIITGGMKIDAETRAAAKQEVRDTIERAAELDRRELLGTRADAIDAERREAIARRHGLEASTVVLGSDIATRLAAFGRRDTEPPQSEATMLADLRDLSISGPLRTHELAAVRWALERLDPPRAGNGG